MDLSYPLLKIPFLLSVGYLAHLAGTSPQGSPKESEEAKFVGVEQKGSRTIITTVSPIIKSVVTLSCLAESAVILAHNFPAHPLAAPVLDVLSRSTSATGVRLSSTFLAGWGLFATGTLIRVACYRYLGRFFTFKLALRDEHRLITSGPYAVVRHPAYTGAIVLFAGIAMFQLGPGSWWRECMGLWDSVPGKALTAVWMGVLSAIPISVFMRTGAEDKILRDEFKMQWDVWARNTPYKLIPGIY
ncbi:hypothetical protein A0H81_06272 [Grifola frondosa]|uniref:Uncharacterized protein n=1 Tax=Grifola frondosa TaxID=5627 RepID=A0A1C7M9U1_GRIFR|nr:hypothetical protein A0H81_06272 [Grifola frondosa]